MAQPASRGAPLPLPSDPASPSHAEEEPRAPAPGILPPPLQIPHPPSCEHSLGVGPFCAGTSGRSQCFRMGKVSEREQPEGGVCALITSHQENCPKFVKMWDRSRFRIWKRSRFSRFLTAQINSPLGLRPVPGCPSPEERKVTVSWAVNWEAFYDSQGLSGPSHILKKEAFSFEHRRAGQVWSPGLTPYCHKGDREWKWRLRWTRPGLHCPFLEN